MLGSLILYLKGMRTTTFQLSGFYSSRFHLWSRISAKRPRDLGGQHAAKGSYTLGSLRISQRLKKPKPQTWNLARMLY